MDAEGWFSVTPEQIACHIACRARVALDALAAAQPRSAKQPQPLKDHSRPYVVLDAFCGCGGNSIAFARAGFRVLAVDLDQQRLEMARHNAVVYEVDHLIEFICADSLAFCQGIAASHAEVDCRQSNASAAKTDRRPAFPCVDLVYLAPPWGGVDYTKSGQNDFSLETMVPVEGGGLELLRSMLRWVRTPNVIYQLPRNVDDVDVQTLAAMFTEAADTETTVPFSQSSSQLWSRAWGSGCESSLDDKAARPPVVECEFNYLNRKLKMVTAYFGWLCAT